MSREQELINDYKEAIELRCEAENIFLHAEKIISSGMETSESKETYTGNFSAYLITGKSINETPNETMKSYVKFLRRTVTASEFSKMVYLDRDKVNDYINNILMKDKLPILEDLGDIGLNVDETYNMEIKGLAYTPSELPSESFSWDMIDSCIPKRKKAKRLMALENSARKSLGKYMVVNQQTENDFCKIIQNFTIVRSGTIENSERFFTISGLDRDEYSIVLGGLYTKWLRSRFVKRDDLFDSTELTITNDKRLVVMNGRSKPWMMKRR